MQLSLFVAENVGKNDSVWNETKKRTKKARRNSLIPSGKLKSECLKELSTFFFFLARKCKWSYFPFPQAWLWEMLCLWTSRPHLPFSLCPEQVFQQRQKIRAWCLLTTSCKGGSVTAGVSFSSTSGVKLSAVPGFIYLGAPRQEGLRAGLGSLVVHPHRFHGCLCALTMACREMWAEREDWSALLSFSCDEGNSQEKSIKQECIYI